MEELTALRLFLAIVTVNGLLTPAIPDSNVRGLRQPQIQVHIASQSLGLNPFVCESSASARSKGFYYLYKGVPSQMGR